MTKNAIFSPSGLLGIIFFVQNLVVVKYNMAPIFNKKYQTYSFRLLCFRYSSQEDSGNWVQILYLINSAYLLVPYAVYFCIYSKLSD